MIRVLSLGAGVQSTTIALMAARGELPKIDLAIFADTQSEPKAVYAHLEKLKSAVPFEVCVVTKGSLRQEILNASNGVEKTWARPPLFLRNPDGSPGMTRRQCTSDYKIEIILREVRKRAGIKPRSRGPKSVVVEQIIGISLDESHRMRDADFRWIRHDYPLVDLKMTRKDCVAKLAAYGWTAPKSSCTFCPYHSDATWLAMKEIDPESFEDAATVDDSLRTGKHYQLDGVPFLHAARIPLREVDFAARIEAKAARDPHRHQMNFFDDGFGNECEGVCGV